MHMYAIQSGNKKVKAAIPPSRKLAKCLMHPASFVVHYPGNRKRCHDVCMLGFRMCVGHFFWTRVGQETNIR